MVSELTEWCLRTVVRAGGAPVLFGEAGPTSHGKPAVVDSYHRALFVMLRWWDGGPVAIVRQWWWQCAGRVVIDRAMAGL